MKTILRLLVLACMPLFGIRCFPVVAVAPLALTSCQTTRVTATQTLKVVGQAAEEAVATSARLYRDGKITAKQARDIADNYDRIFQPAFRVAKDAVLGNLESIAPANVIQLGANIVALVAQLQKPSP